MTDRGLGCGVVDLVYDSVDVCVCRSVSLRNVCWNNNTHEDEHDT